MKDSSCHASPAAEERKKENDGGEWRFRNNIPLIVVCILTGGAVLGVHYLSISKDRTDISLPSLMESIESKCQYLGNSFTRSSGESVLHPVPTQLGVAVWVAQEQWSVPVHDTLDRIERALSVVGSRKHRLIQRVVRVSKSGAENQMESGDGRDVRGGSSTKVSDDSLANAAVKQQLGLAVAKHAFTIDLQEELVMHAVSFFPAPQSTDKSVRCFLFDDRRAYCTVPTSMGADTMRREVEAAVATLMAGWLEIENFRDPKSIQRWETTRKARSCHYALRSLKQLQMSVDAHPEMPVPEGVKEAVDRLEAILGGNDLASLARAAADLQFHQLLLPQIYIPWDQAVVNHLSILMPIYGVVSLAVRLIKENAEKERALKGLKK